MFVVYFFLWAMFDQEDKYGHFHILHGAVSCETLHDQTLWKTSTPMFTCVTDELEEAMSNKLF